MGGVLSRPEGVCQSPGKGKRMKIGTGNRAEVLHAQEGSHIGVENATDDSVVQCTNHTNSGESNNGLLQIT